MHDYSLVDIGKVKVISMMAATNTKNSPGRATSLSAYYMIRWVQPETQIGLLDQRLCHYTLDMHDNGQRRK